MIADYFSRLFAAFGEGWTRFWFTPSRATGLGLIRLCVGLLVVWLHATLWLDLVEFFGPNGLLPVGELTPLEGQTLSYLNWHSAPVELHVVHAIGLAVLVAFAVGYRSRLTSVLALLVFLSDVNRGVVITGRTESICAMLMLYLCVGPSGEAFSLDRWQARRRQTKSRRTKRPRRGGQSHFSPKAPKNWDSPRRFCSTARNHRAMRNLFTPRPQSPCG